MWHCTCQPGVSDLHQPRLAKQHMQLRAGLALELQIFGLASAGEQTNRSKSLTQCVLC